LVTVFAHQAAVEGFATSFLSTRHAVSHRHGNAAAGQQHGHGGDAAAVKMFFGPSGVFPKLYDGWFKKTGQIQKDMVAGAKAALRCVRLFTL